jgi:hypothetical protein
MLLKLFRFFNQLPPLEPLLFRILEQVGNQLKGLTHFRFFLIKHGIHINFHVTHLLYKYGSRSHSQLRPVRCKDLKNVPYAQAGSQTDLHILQSPANGTFPR